VRYAIADVAAFVAPGSPLDEEAHRRGVTLYAPDGNTRLYPPELSEGAASLLPGELRPALVWTMDVDETGEGTDVHVRKARVRSRKKLDYGGVQHALDDGSADEVLRLLREVGILRQQREARRGGVSLQLPEQEVMTAPDGYELSYRAPFPVEGWNAQISLMTGMAAAELMLEGEVGILRTVPAADPARLERFRHTAKALGVLWPKDTPYPAFVRTPGLVVYCETPADVRRCLEFARRLGLDVRCRSGGHSTAGFSVADGSMVIDTSRMRFGRPRALVERRITRFLVP